MTKKGYIKIRKILLGVNKMMHTVAIQEDGTVMFLYSDELYELLDIGKSVTRKASYIEPCADGWIADLTPVYPGVTLGPYRLRSEAVQAEIKYLEENLL